MQQCNNLVISQCGIIYGQVGFIHSMLGTAKSSHFLLDECLLLPATALFNYAVLHTYELYTFAFFSHWLLPDMNHCQVSTIPKIVFFAFVGKLGCHFHFLTANIPQSARASATTSNQPRIAFH